jgi:hypothetical protein
MLKRTLACIVAAGALAFHAAFAGLFSAGLGDPDIVKIRRLGVVSALGDTLMGRSVGITVFNNKSFKATLPNRNLDAVFSKTMADTIAASSKITGEVALLKTEALDAGSIVDAARGEDFDAVVVMQPTEDTQFHMTGPGLTVWRTGYGQKAFTCNSMRIVVLRVADSKELAAASDYQCPNFSNLPFWHNTWEEFTDDERQMIYREMEVFVKHQVDETLKRLKLHAPK